MKGFKTTEELQKDYLVNHIIGCDTYKAPAGTAYIPENLLVIEPDKAPRKGTLGEFVIVGLIEHSYLYSLRKNIPPYLSPVEITAQEIKEHIRQAHERMIESELEYLLRLDEGTKRLLRQ